MFTVIDHNSIQQRSEIPGAFNTTSCVGLFVGISFFISGSMCFIVSRIPGESMGSFARYHYAGIVLLAVGLSMCTLILSCVLYKKNGLRREAYCRGEVLRVTTFAIADNEQRPDGLELTSPDLRLRLPMHGYTAVPSQNLHYCDCMANYHPECELPEGVVPAETPPPPYEEVVSNYSANVLFPGR